MSWEDPTYVVCVGKAIGPNQQKFTEIGVAWATENKNGKISISLDLTVILGPTDKIYLFFKDKKGKAVNPDE